MFSALLLVFMTLLAGPGALAEPLPSADADAIYRNARVFTANTSAAWANAIAVKGNQFTYVGDDAGSKAYAGQKTRVYDLEGRLVLPGLIDAHTHPGYIGLTSGHIQLPETSSEDALYKAIKEMVSQYPDRRHLIAMPWPNDLFGPKGPNKETLDALEPNRPVLIWDEWMHSLWVNSKALEVAGVDKNVVDPVAGFSYYQRDEKGELTGYITESAATEFWAKFESLTPKSEAVLLEYLIYLKDHGVTTLFDAGNFGLDTEVYTVVKKLDERGALPVRYYGSYTLFLPQDTDQAVSTLSAMRENFSSDQVTVDTLKIFLDGVIETRTAHMINDYLDTEGNRGNLLMSRSQIKDLLLELEAEKLNAHFHTIGNMATRTALDALEDAQKTLGRDLTIRVAMSHLEVMDPADAARFEELGVIGQFTPHWHGGNDDGSYDRSIGPLQDNMFLTKTLVKDGAVVSFSSDAYFTSDWKDGNASPFAGIQVGHTRQYAGEGPEAPVAKPAAEALTLEEMVMGYTKGGAYQLGTEDTVGSIEPGKKADFIVLNENLFEIDRYSIHNLKPSTVVLDGKVVAGQLPPPMNEGVPPGSSPSN